MTIFIIEHITIGDRGMLRRWLLEIKAGVFVGTISAKVRAYLWQHICTKTNTDGAVMLYSTNTEQGFDIEVFGTPYRGVVNLDGVKFIKITEKLLNTPELPEN